VALRPGDDVVDEVFGPGTVIRETRRGYLIALESPAGFKLDRDRASLALPDGMPVGPASDTDAALTRTAAGSADSSDLQARRAIDALRFGIVPPSHLGELTLGHDELISWANENLAAPASPPRAAAVYGPFGAGKSHAMAAIREFARSRGYLAMATEINGDEISLSQPRELLASLLLHLADDSDLDGAAPILSLVRSAFGGGARVPGGGRATSLGAAARTARRLEMTRQFSEIEPLVERLLGSDPSVSKTDFDRQVRDALGWNDYAALTYDREYDPTPLVAYSPVAQRPFDFAQALIGFASLARNAGFEGLVVTIDELEVEAAMYAAARWRKLLAFVAAMHAEFSQDEPIVGGLSIFMAALGEGSSVEDQIVDIIVDATGGDRYRLRPWDDNDLMVLSKRIHDLYCAAYAMERAYDRSRASATFDLIDDLDLDHSGRIRMFIRAYVARLDVQYGPPIA
jgi:hypothetical protein